MARNWRCAEGEIDLVCTREKVLAVVEVKARSGLGFGTPAESVTAAKAGRLRGLALRFLESHTGLRRLMPRFDVAEVHLGPDGSTRVEVIEDAF